MAALTPGSKAKFRDPLEALGLLDEVTAGIAKLSAEKEFDVDCVIEFVKSRVIGQDEAVEAISWEIKAGFADKNPKRRKPTGVFALGGPPGTGKTHTCQQFSEAIFGSTDAMFTITGSNFTSRESLSTLFGVPAGYAGSGKVGSLVSFVDTHRNGGIVVLDEFEKATEELLTKFLGIWGGTDDLYDASNADKPISCRNIIFFLTTNAAQDRILNLSKTMDSHDLSKAILSLWKDSMRPEVIDRISHAFAFAPLDDLNSARLLTTALIKAANRFDGIALDDANGLNAEVILFVLRKMKAENAGARSIERIINQTLQRQILRLRDKGTKLIRLAIEDDDIKVLSADPVKSSSLAAADVFLKNLNLGE